MPSASAASVASASEACIQFIKDVEGFSPQPYYDYNQHTVGYGTQCPTDKYLEYMANGISRSEAEVLLRETVAEISSTINERLIRQYHLSFTQHEFDALVSFSYNLGTGWMTYDSTLRNTLLDYADDNTLVYAFSLYSTAGGNYLPALINRRLCEANMFLNGVYSQTVDKNYGHVFYEPNGGSLTYRVQGFICDDLAFPAEDAVRSGDVFLGWFTDLTGGSEVSTLNKSLSGKTLFARWQFGENPERQDSQSVAVRVTGDVVNIRKGPGTTYGIAKKVYRNDMLIVSNVTTLSNTKWGKVQDGWICLDYTNYTAVISGTGNTTVKPQTPSVNQGPVWGTVRVNDGLRVRSGPGTVYSIVGYLYDGRRVQILEQTVEESTLWGRTENGWVCMDYIAVDEAYINQTKPGQGTVQRPSQSVSPNSPTVLSGKVTADALRIRSGAGDTYPIVDFYYENDLIFITEQVQIDSVSWGKTDKGWINMNYVVTESFRENPPQSSLLGTKTVIADCLRVRKGIGTEYKIAQLLYYGDKVTVLETTIVDGTVWGKVANGWICMDYVQ